MAGRGSTFFWPGKDPEATVAGFGQKRLPQQKQAFLRTLDQSGFNWLVFIVAASGFFTDSYNLFASNVILPALAYVYWGTTTHGKALAFNLATLIASAVGQLVFGFLADRYGRRSLYGIELVIVIFSTIGLLQCSPGVSDSLGHSTWDVSAWIIFWRTIMGFGIGAGQWPIMSPKRRANNHLEYPLSATIAAEWSSTRSRGRMLAAVFLMQPLGQLCAYGAGLTALRIFSYSKVDIDKLWRYVVGVGAFPTLLALGFRVSMPESGRFTYDVRKMATKPEAASIELQPERSDASQSDSPERPVGDNDQWSSSQFRTADLREYLFHRGNWTYLFGTSVCWFLLDYAFCESAISTPTILSG